MSTSEILALPLVGNAAKAATVGEYLAALLKALWTEENASGKRVFQESSWKSPIEIAFIRANIVEGTIDEDGYIERVDSKAVDKIILSCVTDVFSIPPAIRFLQSALAVLDVMRQLPQTMVAGGGEGVLRFSLQQAQRAIEQQPTYAREAIFVQLVQATITSLGGFAQVIPALQGHPTYTTFLENAREMKRIFDISHE